MLTTAERLDCGMSMSHLWFHLGWRVVSPPQEVLVSIEGIFAKPWALEQIWIFQKKTPGKTPLATHGYQEEQKPWSFLLSAGVRHGSLRHESFQILCGQTLRGLHILKKPADGLGAKG